jgi:hypothetical protein
MNKIIEKFDKNRTVDDFFVHYDFYCTRFSYPSKVDTFNPFTHTHTLKQKAY